MRWSYVSAWVILVSSLIGVSSLEPNHVHQSPNGEVRLQRFRRIINGRVANKGVYRYIVSIQAKLRNGLQSLLFGGMEHFCGGTLINQNWILTAAHCLYAYTEEGEVIPLLEPKKWHVRMATGKLRPSFLDRIKGFFNRVFNTFFGYSKLQSYYHLSKIILHPAYTEGFLENDIALLRLKEPVIMHRIKALDPINLPTTVAYKDWPKKGQNCTALGWGCACSRCPPQMHMQELRMPILGTEECRSIYKAPINLTETKEFCAGFYKENTGICPGDSGGPLVCEFEGEQLLAGVISATHAKLPESYPAVFTRVTYFRNWINETIHSN